VPALQVQSPVPSKNKQKTQPTNQTNKKQSELQNYELSKPIFFIVSMPLHFIKVTEN
jgi:hypothetical protein